MSSVLSGDAAMEKPRAASASGRTLTLARGVPYAESPYSRGENGY
jgi:hypothetical protein